jgi:ferredoxin
VPRIKVDPLACEGAGRCRQLAPQTFKIVNGQAHIINAAGDPVEAIVEAARRCPTHAIAVYDDDGQPLFVPD